MNKIIIFFTACLFLASCNRDKNETVSPVKSKVSQNIAKKQSQAIFDGKKIVFSNEKAFEEEMLKIDTDDDMKSFEDIFPNHVSYRKKYYDEHQKIDTLIDEALSSVLNADAVVQIGNWAFKLDQSNEKVYAIESVFADSNYNDLVAGNIGNAKIIEFSADDNVIDLLNEGVRTQEDLRTKFWGWFCRRPGCGARYEQSISKATPNTEILAISWYRKHGIWFTLSSLGRYRRNNNVPPILFDDRAFSQNG